MLAYYNGNYVNALLHLFPDIGLDKSMIIRRTPSMLWLRGYKIINSIHGFVRQILSRFEQPKKLFYVVFKRTQL